MLLFLTIVLVLHCPNNKDTYISNLKEARTKRHVQDELINEILSQLNRITT